MQNTYREIEEGVISSDRPRSPNIHGPVPRALDTRRSNHNTHSPSSLFVFFVYLLFVFLLKILIVSISLPLLGWTNALGISM